MVAPQVPPVPHVLAERRDVAGQHRQVDVLVLARQPGERLDRPAAHEPPRSREPAQQRGHATAGRAATSRRTGGRRPRPRPRRLSAAAALAPARSRLRNYRPAAAAQRVTIANTGGRLSLATCGEEVPVDVDAAAGCTASASARWRTRSPGVAWKARTCRPARTVSRLVDHPGEGAAAPPPRLDRPDGGRRRRRSGVRPRRRRRAGIQSCTANAGLFGLAAVDGRREPSSARSAAAASSLIGGSRRAWRSRRDPRVGDPRHRVGPRRRPGLEHLLLRHRRAAGSTLPGRGTPPTTCGQ